MRTTSKQLSRQAGERLKEFRKQLGYTPPEMAAQLGITASSYYKTERGDQFFGNAMLHHISGKYNLSMDWLLLGKGPRNVTDRERLETLEKENKTLKESLEQQRTQMQEQLDTRQKKIELLSHELDTADEKRDARLKPDVKEILGLIDKDSIFYHEIVLFFHKYKEKRIKETGTAF